MIKVLFVCTGNICRSPTAEGVFRALVEGEGLADRIVADSAGTHGYHVGEPPDGRSTAAAAKRGIELCSLRARKVRPADFDEFDLVLAMDRGHYDILRRLCPPGRADRVRLFLDFAPELGIKDVPDPYYGAGDGFERVLDMVEAGSRGLLDHIRADLMSRSSSS
ncbi:MAG TPA: low molecular weight protein-tyrosine-phosphatase [Magnetospirillum sp.]|jgi:protein-tyrosine phosphatase|nr:low molecular weight protein-tyrosine-phosphatase [Magnetospirillum sp.]